MVELLSLLDSTLGSMFVGDMSTEVGGRFLGGHPFETPPFDGKAMCSLLLR